MRLLAFPILLLCSACQEPDVIYEVEYSGSVISDQTGAVELWFLHSQWGEDTLETSYMVIDTLWIDDASTFSGLLEVPQGTGSGLSIYGWQDLNDDGEHCRPGTDPELAGLATFTDYPNHVVEVELILDTACEGPEGI